MASQISVPVYSNLCSLLLCLSISVSVCVCVYTHMHVICASLTIGRTDERDVYYYPYMYKPEWDCKNFQELFEGPTRLNMNLNPGVVFFLLALLFLSNWNPFSRLCPCPSVVTKLSPESGAYHFRRLFCFSRRWLCWVKGLRVFPVQPWYFSLLLSLGSKQHCLKQEEPFL